MRSSVWKGSLSFGFLNIPVSLQTAQEDKDLHFTMLDEKTLSPIHYKKVDPTTGGEIPQERIVKGYEYSKGSYVVLEDKDFKNANIRATENIEIEDFVPLEEIDLMMFEKPYYLVPKKEEAKGYFLLHDALENTKKVAIAKIVIKSKQHLCAILPMGECLILEVLRFAHQLKQLHEVNFLKDIPKPRYSEKEMETAEALINELSTKWHPEKYKDTYYDDVMKLIRDKIKYGEEYVVPKSEKQVPPPAEKVTDLLPLLRKSLEARKNGSKKSVKSTLRHFH